ncbi:hypothetical protein [Alsobacter sp. SYSU BS001988]
MEKEQANALASVLYVLSAQLADLGALVMTLAEDARSSHRHPSREEENEGQPRDAGLAGEDLEAQADAIRRAMRSYGHPSWVGLRRAVDAELGRSRRMVHPNDAGVLRRVRSLTELDAQAILRVLDHKSWGRAPSKARRAKTDLQSVAAPAPRSAPNRLRSPRADKCGAP